MVLLHSKAVAAAAAAIAAAPKQTWSGQQFVRSHAASAAWASVSQEANRTHVHTMNESEYNAVFSGEGNIDGASGGGGGASTTNGDTTGDASAAASSKRNRGFAGWERRDTGVRAATGGLASVHVVRSVIHNTHIYIYSLCPIKKS